MKSDRKVPTKAEMDRKLGFDTERPTYAQTAHLLGVSERHVATLMAAGHLTKGGDIRRHVAEWAEYQAGLRHSGSSHG